ncbi:protein spinster 2 [Clarias magur]|uniref:Protein spinster 2 n=1 Tax=Clarias magur TaxID=1594786 RepID=A0A8J4UDK5_CLAMG|nr:protein spinster 2 [Clarias magur]
MRRDSSSAKGDGKNRQSSARAPKYGLLGISFPPVHELHPANLRVYSRCLSYPNTHRRARIQNQLALQQTGRCSPWVTAACLNALLVDAEAASEWTKECGLFICSFMVAAPIFGYLGDRFNRKVILSCGIFFWSAVTLLSSFISQEYYWLFVLSRGLVGIGESSYSSISPTIIGDLFTNNKRTVMLSVFYLAIPLGSGLGYILGSSAKDLAQDWHWALRVSPVLGLTAGILILVFVPEPKRGSVDPSTSRTRTSWVCDMKALLKNRSYMFSSLGSAAVSFATGAFGIWIPQYLVRAQEVQETAVSKDSLIFGVITCVTGLLGVVIGAATTRFCRQKTERADPLVCAVSMLGSAIFICLIFVVAKKSIVGAYICIFIGETLLFLNWAITADILMYVVVPTRRATAVAFQGFTSHLLGDAGSPYLIGLISDALQESYATSVLWSFLSLGYALMLCPFVIVLGGMFFLATALFFLDDREKAERLTKQLSQSLSAVKVTK